MNHLILTEGEGFRDGWIGGKHVFRYVFLPETPTTESPRPYFHPLKTFAGNVLTLFRPTDHPWHHALSMTLTRVGNTNFWGGATYKRNEGYVYRGDHGRQLHLSWHAGEIFAEELEWQDAAGKPLIHEHRSVSCPRFDDGTYVLEFKFLLRNISGETLQLGTYQSLEGLEGSHYGGLQFRFPREFLTYQEGFTPSVIAGRGARGVAEIHGGQQAWMALIGNHDETLSRSTVAFFADDDRLPDRARWFVREDPPLVACPLLGPEPLEWPPEENLRLGCRLMVSDGALPSESIEAQNLGIERS